MDVNQVNVNSPIRILERCCRGGVRMGELGVVMGRAGVGKTAFLVQSGLDDALRGNHVLHVALGQDLEHVQSWYDALFDDLAEATRLDDREVVRQHLIRHRVIQAYADTVFPHERLDDLVALYGKTGFTPAVVVVDGLRWEREPIVEQAAELGALKQIAKRLGAILWVTAQTHRELRPVGARRHARVGERRRHRGVQRGAVRHPGGHDDLGVAGLGDVPPGPRVPPPPGHLDAVHRRPDYPANFSK